MIRSWSRDGKRSEPQLTSKPKAKSSTVRRSIFLPNVGEKAKLNLRVLRYVVMPIIKRKHGNTRSASDNPSHAV